MQGSLGEKIGEGRLLRSLRLGARVDCSIGRCGDQFDAARASK
jgi:hypothetical protein